MSLVFREHIGLAAAVSQSALIVLARVERLSHQDQVFHVRVERVLKGEVAVGSELEIHPAGHQQGEEAAQAMANGLSLSYVVPTLEGRAPAVRKKSPYVFLLQLNGELVAMNAWRGAKEVDAVAALVTKA